jgi:peptidyl-prolyl cis-trans isomerase D
MLKAFRQQGLTSAVYGALIVATVMVFVIQFRPGAQGRSGSIKQECAAEIRGRCIEPKEYQAELMLTAPGRMFDPTQLQALNVRKAVLDGLVERTLLVQDAERLGITISEEDLDNELVAGRAHVSLPADRAPKLGQSLGLIDNAIRILPVLNRETKQFDYKTYDRIVRQFSNRSPTEFKAMQREELIAARVRDLVRTRVRVGDDEAFTGYQREKSSATIRFVSFRRSWFAHHALDLSPPAIDAWVKEHKQEVDSVFETRKSQYLPECRSARHILIKLPDGATDEQKAEAEKKINAVLERVRKGEDFAKVAREESDDSSASEGGDLQCFQRGRMVKPFEDTVFALAPGQISDVVKTQFGYHVIKLDGIYKDAEAETIGRRETAKSIMISHEGEAMAAETAKKVLAAVKAGTKLDAAVADALPTAKAKKASSGAGKDKKKDDAAKSPTGGEAAKADDAANQDSDRPHVEISAPFNSNADPITGVSSGQNVAQIVFKLEKDGDTPDDLVKLDDGYAVVQLKEKNPATREQFETERETFVASLLAGKQFDALNGYILRLQEAARSETKLNDAYGKAPAKEKQTEGDEE